MGYDIKVNHEGKYVIHEHKGKIKREEIGEFWKELLKMDVFIQNNYNLLSDYREGELDFDLGELDYIEEFLESIKDIIDGRRYSVLVNNPHDTTISLMFEVTKGNNLNFTVKTFSTEKAAISFLKSGIL